jgi:hypothetical protein
MCVLWSRGGRGRERERERERESVCVCAICASGFMYALRFPFFPLTIKTQRGHTRTWQGVYVKAVADLVRALLCCRLWTWMHGRDVHTAGCATELMLWMKEWIRLAQLKVLAVVLKERAH